MADDAVRAALGLPFRQVDTSGDELERQKSLFDKLMSSWFSNSRSTEAIMRGTVNEAAVFRTLKSKLYIKAIFEVGMLAQIKLLWIACSLDAVALVILPNGEIVIAVVEIKSSICDESLACILSVANQDLVICEFGDEAFRARVPEKHMGQLLQQLVVSSLRHVLYVAASETGITYAVLIVATQALLRLAVQTLQREASDTIEWLHTDPLMFPTFVSRENRRIIKADIPFFKLVDNYVRDNDALPPIKLFKHGSQSFYSKTKCGVDGGAQARAMLRCPTSSLPWEQKIVSQSFKTVAHNAFVAYRMLERKDDTASSESFGSLEDYRSRLNKVWRNTDVTV